jgi:hypothetical protein
MPTETHSNATLYLARLLGLDLILIALAVAVTHDRMVVTIQQLLAQPVALFLSGILALGVGLAIVIGHNRWSSLLAIVVTLLGWVSLLKGLVFVFLPMHVAGGVFGGALHYPLLFDLYTAITFLIGLYLTIAGFRTKIA